MNKRLALPIACGAIVFALALAACGGGDSEVEAISETISESIVSADPSKCTELMTIDFVEQNASAGGAAAIESCEAEASDSSDDPEQITVSGVSVDGATASAEVAFVGGGFDGQTVAVELVKGGDRWKLDRIGGFVAFDAEALAATLEDRFEAASDELTQQQISCIGDLVRKASKQRMEDLLLAGEATEFIEFVQPCE